MLASILSATERLTFADVLRFSLEGRQHCGKDGCDHVRIKLLADGCHPLEHMVALKADIQITAVLSSVCSTVAWKPSHWALSSCFHPQSNKPTVCQCGAWDLLPNQMTTGRSPPVFTLRAISLLSISAWCLIFTAQPNNSSLPSLSPVSLRSFLSKQGQLTYVLCIPRSMVRNKLPQNVWRASSVNSFKTAKKTDLFHH